MEYGDGDSQVEERDITMEDKVYVAVGGDVESKSTLIWALQNTRAKELCIFHVHQLLQISSSRRLKTHRKEREKAHKILDKYLQICLQMGVRAEKLYIELDTIEKGIVQLVSEQRVRKLVMGAASDRHYSMRMRDPKSKKAIFVHQHAPPSCHIWFTCKEYLICTREAVMDDNHLEYAPSHHPIISRARSGSSGQESASNGPSYEGLSQFEMNMGTQSAPILSDPTVIQVAVAEAEKSKQEALLETSRRMRSEKDAMDAITRAKNLENAYSEEFERRKETEKALAKTREELQKKRSLFENRIAETDRKVTKLHDKYRLAVESSKRFEEEREELQRERDRALRELDELRRNQSEPSAPRREPPHCFFCPILKDIMEEPHVAADGFTYEEKAIRQWIESGHDTSPMTNAKLKHLSLVPNLSLRSAIQDWRA